MISNIQPYQDLQNYLTLQTNSMILEYFHNPDEKSLYFSLAPSVIIHI